MNILIVNDDGVDAVGIRYLAEKAMKYGNVTVVAPDGQCSAMSQRISICKEMSLKRITDIYPPEIEAYSLSGTPADCVKVANHFFKDKGFDYCFSGINLGFNSGYDIYYSGTVGAANEAIMNGIPAVAFSTSFEGHFDIVDKYIDRVFDTIFAEKSSTEYLWNVNFPSPVGNDYKGLLLDRKLARGAIIWDNYDVLSKTDTETLIKGNGVFAKREAFTEDTDIAAILDGYISVGKIFLR